MQQAPGTAENPQPSSADADGVPVFQLIDPGLVQDQYGFFADLRAKSPVWWAELPDGTRWLVPTRYEDIRLAHLDPVLRQKPDPEDDPVSDEEGGIWRVYNEHPVVSDPRSTPACASSSPAPSPPARPSVCARAWNRPSTNSWTTSPDRAPTAHPST